MEIFSGETVVIAWDLDSSYVLDEYSFIFVFDRRLLNIVIAEIIIFILYIYYFKL